MTEPEAERQQSVKGASITHHTKCVVYGVDPVTGDARSRRID